MGANRTDILVESRAVAKFGTGRNLVETNHYLGDSRHDSGSHVEPYRPNFVLYSKSDTVMKLSDKSAVSGSAPPPQPANKNGDKARMEERTSKLESLAEKTLERITFLDVDLAIIKSNYATKEDIAKMEGILLKWFIGTAVAIAGLAFAAAKFIH